MASPGRRSGVVVQRAEPDSPAADAGLRDGDAIEAIDGNTVTTMEEVQAIVTARAPGQTVLVRVRRAGRARTFRVMLGSRPAQAASR